MRKKILTAIFIFSFAVLSCLPAFAAETQTEVEQGKNDITRTEKFTTTSTDFKHEFDEAVVENGKKYDLKAINYKVLETKKLEREEPVLHKVDYTNLYSKNAEPPKTLTIPKDGKDIQVELTNLEYTPTTITNRQEILSAYTDFDYKTVKPVPEATKTITYFDKGSKQEVTATLKLKELQEAEPWAWKDDVTIPITFSLYDAEYYVLGDKYIPYNDEQPALKGYETDLLDVLNLDTEKYKIISVEWDGAPYTIGEVRYRKAIAHGKRYVANYVAIYESTVNLPNADGYNAVAQYEAKVEVASGDTEYTVQATAIYTPNNTTAIIIASVIGGLIFIVLLVIAILYILSRKNRKKEKKEITV